MHQKEMLAEDTGMGTQRGWRTQVLGGTWKEKYLQRLADSGPTKAQIPVSSSYTAVLLEFCSVAANTRAGRSVACPESSAIAALETLESCLFGDSAEGSLFLFWSEFMTYSFY